MYRSLRQREIKAQAGWGLILVAFVFVAGVLLLLTLTLLQNKGIIETKNTISISMDVDDRGTEFLSLMNANKNNGMYITLLGDMVAANIPLDLSDDITTTLDSMHSSYIMRLQYSGMSDKIFSNGDVSEGDEYRIEIPVPGAQPGKVKAYIKLKR